MNRKRYGNGKFHRTLGGRRVQLFRASDYWYEIKERLDDRRWSVKRLVRRRQLLFKQALNMLDRIQRKQDRCLSRKYGFPDPNYS